MYWLIFYISWNSTGKILRPDAARCVRFSRWNSSLRQNTDASGPGQGSDWFREGQKVASRHVSYISAIVFKHVSVDLARICEVYEVVKEIFCKSLFLHFLLSHNVYAYRDCEETSIQRRLALSLWATEQLE